MITKLKCGTANCERDATHKGMCSGCYAKMWRERRALERAKSVAQLTEGIVHEAEIVPADIAIPDAVPETHLVATSPVQMQAAQGDLKTWLENKLAVLERDIREANAALAEARRNGWATSALTNARNRAVDDETFYNKVLGAVEAGHTIIPDFPVSVFAIRRATADAERANTWTARVDNSVFSDPAQPDYAPAGVGEYRNPEPKMFRYYMATRKDREGREYNPYRVERKRYPVGPITFPSMTARSPIMKATAKAMEEKCFDQIAVCYPVHPQMGRSTERQVTTTAGRAGDPLVIGQVVHKPQGAKHRVVSFIIAWHLDLDTL